MAMSKQIRQLHESPILPDEIIEDILLRLPAKFIDRFKCVSKSWRSLLSSSLFFKQHLKFDDQILLFDKSWSLLGNDGVLRKLDLPHADLKKHLYVTGSCHGLVLIMQNLGDFRGIVVNPVTLEAIQIPKIGLPSDTDHVNECMFGLGYDRSENDFTIVSISRYNRNGPRNHVSIYSLKTKAWKSLETSPFEHSMVSKGVFVGGCLHWISRRKDKAFSIAAFNLVTKEFEDVQYPQGVECLHRGFHNALVVLGGCLAMVICLYRCCNNSFSSSVDVWLMKEYGVQDSWTKFRIHVPQDSDSCFGIVSFLNENEVVLVESVKGDKKLVAYDWRTKVWRDMGLDFGTPNSLSENEIVSPKETLLSPRYH